MSPINDNLKPKVQPEKQTTKAPVFKRTTPKPALLSTTLPQYRLPSSSYDTNDGMEKDLQDLESRVDVLEKIAMSGVKNSDVLTEIQNLKKILTSQSQNDAGIKNEVMKLNDNVDSLKSETRMRFNLHGKILSDGSAKLDGLSKNMESLSTDVKNQKMPSEVTEIAKNISKILEDHDNAGYHGYNLHGEVDSKAGNATIGRSHGSLSWDGFRRYASQVCSTQC